MRKKKKRKSNSTFNIVISIIFDIMSLIILSLFTYLKILPNKYYILVLIIIFILAILISFLLLKKNIKKKIKKITKIISIVIIILYLIIIYYLYNTASFFGNIKKIDYDIEQYYVVVNKDSDYNKISDINDEYIYVSKSSDNNLKKAKDKLSKKVSITYKETGDIDKMVSYIKDEKIIFISSSLYSALCEDEYKLDDISKIIYKIKVISKNEKNSKSVNITKESFNIYISGVDNTDALTTVSRSDVNMVVTVNPVTNKILMTSIPRDYYVTLHSYNSKDKLTHASMYGINESVNTIEDLLDIDINYYVRVNFNTVIDLVDVIGGITVDSKYSFTTHGMKQKYSFTKGKNNLDGKKALAYARERKSFSDGDRQRVKNQQDVLTAIINKMTSSKTLLTSYSDILNTLEKSFQTNMGENEIKALIKYQLNDMPSWEIEKYSLDGTDSSNVTYTFGNQKLYVMEPDDTTIVEAKTNIQNLIEEE